MDDQPSMSAPTVPASSPPTRPVDVKALAERVYRLMLEDLRLEQARRGSSGGRR